MIELKRINKYYKTGKNMFQALKDVSLTIDDGEFVSIMGQSGAGKSTLMHIIGTLDDFDSGSYMLDGELVNTMKDKKKSLLRSSKIGFVMQDFALINHETVLYNVMLPMYFSNVKYSEMKKIAIDKIMHVGLGDQVTKKVNQLSGGQKQRVAIARALVAGASMILADEPTGQLDSNTGKEIMELLKTLNEEDGITVILVTHDLSISEYSRRRIVLSDGKIVSNEKLEK